MHVHTHIPVLLFYLLYIDSMSRVTTSVCVCACLFPVLYIIYWCDMKLSTVVLGVCLVVLLTLTLNTVLHTWVLLLLSFMVVSLTYIVTKIVIDSFYNRSVQNPFQYGHNYLSCNPYTTHLHSPLFSHFSPCIQCLSCQQDHTPRERGAAHARTRTHTHTPVVTSCLYNHRWQCNTHVVITSEMLSIVGEREQSVMLVWSETLCAHAIRMCMLSGVDMLREEL